jgi:hypothetical protein
MYTYFFKLFFANLHILLRAYSIITILLRAYSIIMILINLYSLFFDPSIILSDIEYKHYISESNFTDQNNNNNNSTQNNNNGNENSYQYDSNRFLYWCIYMRIRPQISYDDFNRLWDNNISLRAQILRDRELLIHQSFRRHHYVENLGWFTSTQIRYLNSLGYTIDNNRIVRINRR